MRSKTTKNSITQTLVPVIFDFVRICAGIDGSSDDEAFKAYPDDNVIRGTAHPHPEYDDYAEFPNTLDIGVVVLDEPVYLNAYGELPELYLLETFTRQLPV